MLAKTNRLKKSKEFDAVFKKGKSFKESFLILKVDGSKKNTSRFGIVVSQKISKKAVVRNKIKRRIREAVKLCLPKIKKRIDAVLITLPGAERKKFREIKDITEKLFKKAKLIEND